MSILPSPGSALEGPSGGNISDVVGLILDKGLVIDAYVRVSLIGIEILTVDARVVVASVDTYLRFAEAAGRLNLEANGKPGLPDLLQGVTGTIGGLTGAVGAPELVQGLTGAGSNGAGENGAAQLGPAEDPAQLRLAGAEDDESGGPAGRRSTEGGR
jgi:hypothetical protein